MNRKASGSKAETSPEVKAAERRLVSVDGLCVPAAWSGCVKPASMCPPA